MEGTSYRVEGSLDTERVPKVKNWTGLWKDEREGSFPCCCIGLEYYTRVRVYLVLTTYGLLYYNTNLCPGISYMPSLCRGSSVGPLDP